MSGKCNVTARTRAPNFTKEDQVLLFEALKPYSHIIENKQTDAVKQKDKQNAWVKITEVFNSNSSNLPRTTENLISCYRNVKSRLKKQHSEAKMLLSNPIQKEAFVNAIEENGKDWQEVSLKMSQPIEVCQKGFEELVKECKREDNKIKKSVMGTGGGPPKRPKPDDDPLSAIKKMIEPQIDGLYTIYDSDALLMSQYQKSLPETVRIKPLEEEMLNDDSQHVSHQKIILEDGRIGLEEEKNNDEALYVSQELLTPNCSEDLVLPSTSSVTEYHTPVRSRIEILRKKKEPALSNIKENKNKGTLNDSFQRLSEAKLELVELQKKNIIMDMEHKNKIHEIELQELIKQNKHRDEMREKELQLMEIKLKKELSK